MTKFYRFAFVVLALVALLPACSVKKGDRCPTCPGQVDPPPDQTGLEPLGDAAPKHYLKDATGKDTTMWVRLLSVNPPRRSILTYNANCAAGSPKCFQFSAEIGKDDVEPRQNARIGFALSEDCVNSTTGTLEGGSVQPGQSKVLSSSGPGYFDFTPKCLLAEGIHFVTGSPKDDVIGYYPIALEYKNPQ